jgi:flagellar motor switch protein FliG
MTAEQLLPAMQEERVEVGAVLLSKLAVGKAADLLGRLPGERARRITYAVSQTGGIGPDTVHRIGQSLASQLDAAPPRAFDTGPVERIGAILNVSLSATRDDVLNGLDETDKSFATEVRRAIFTFIHIPARIDARDIPKVTRAVDPISLVTALAAATGDLEPVADFILANMSQRMAAQLKEEIAARGKIKEKDGEAAMTEVITAIRELADNREIVLLQEEDG